MIPVAQTNPAGLNLGAQPVQACFGSEVGPVVPVDELHRLPVGFCPPGAKAVTKKTITSSTAETTIVDKKVGLYRDLYGLIISNTSASAATVTIKDSTAGTTVAIFAVPAGDVRGFWGTCLDAIPQSGVNQNWTATCTSVASIEITACTVDRST